ncbi:MAG TPA: hypothetical protein VK619_03980 [Pyrinomonadaceae bacterium]|nr:hypothetical protein [Pyrinomonadaceae bacterium]
MRGYVVRSHDSDMYRRVPVARRLVHVGYRRVHGVRWHVYSVAKAVQGAA